MTCKHEKAFTKHYVGSDDTYEYCPQCKETWGGEETPQKKSLIEAVAEADISEADELEIMRFNQATGRYE